MSLAYPVSNRTRGGMWRTLFLFTATIPALLLLGMMVAQFPLIPLWAAAFLVVPFVIWLVKSPQTLFLFWLVASPLLHEYLNISGGGIPNITLDRVVLPSLVARLTLAEWSAGQRRTRAARMEGMLFFLAGLYVAGEAIGYARGIWPIETSTQYYLDRVLIPLFAFLLARSFVSRHGPKFIQQVITALFCLGVYSIILELLRRYAGFESVLYPNGRLFTYEDMLGTRAVGEFLNPAIFGAMMVLSFAAAFFASWTGWLDRIRWIGAIAFGLAVAASFTRGPWLAFVLVLALILLFTHGRRSRIVLIAIPILMVSTATIMSVPELINQFEARITNTVNIDVRASLASDSFDQFLASPLFGAGAGTFDEQHYSLRTNTYYGVLRPTRFVAHNSLLLMLADRGLVALVPFLLLVTYLLLQSIRLYHHSDKDIRRFIVLAWAGGLCYLVTMNTIEVDFYTYYIAGSWMLIGITSGLARRNERAIMLPIENTFFTMSANVA